MPQRIIGISKRLIEVEEKGMLPQNPEEYYTKYLDFAYKHKKAVHASS